MEKMRAVLRSAGDHQARQALSDLTALAEASRGLIEKALQASFKAAFDVDSASFPA